MGKHNQCPGCECSCHNQVAVLPTDRVLPRQLEVAAPLYTEPMASPTTMELPTLDYIAPEVEHVEIQPTTECECCPNIVPVKEIKKYAGMNMCIECYTKEIELQKANNTPEAQQARVDAHNAAIEEARQNQVPAVLSMNRILQQGREIDSQIKVRTDIFNAQTIAIEELRKAIESDATITNKPLALANELDARFGILKTAIFELNEQVIAKSNEQKALQTYLNQLVLKLRAEEREKFKQHDLTYEPKAAPKPKVNKGPTKKKIDKEEINKYSKELGLPPSILQMMCVSRNMSPKEAFDEMQKTLKK